MCHYSQYDPVGLVHAVAADGREVADALVDILFDDSLDGRYAMAVHRHHGRDHGGRDAARELHGATRLGSVTNHARKVGNHVFHRRRDLPVVAAHQVGNAAARPRGGHHAAAQGRQAAEALLDIDHREVAQHQRTDRLLFGGCGLLGVDHHGKRRRDALVAASRVTHHGDHRPGHAGVARRGGIGQYPREDAVAHNLPFSLATERTP